MPTRLDSSQLDRLPVAAIRRLEAARQSAADANVLAMQASNKLNRLLEEVGTLEARLRFLGQTHLRQSEAVGYDENGRLLHADGPSSVVHGVGDDDPRVVELRKEIDRLNDTVEHCRELAESRSQKFQAAVGLVNGLESFCSRLNGALVEPFDDGTLDAKPKKNETFQQAVERLRRRQRELKADRRSVETAPRHSKFAIAKLDQWLDGLSDRGTPNLLSLVEEGRVDNIGLPIRYEQEAVQVMGRDGTGSGVASVSIAQVDVLALLCWLDGAKLREKLHQLVAEMADDENSLSDEERASRLAEIDGDLLSAERDECALIAMAAAQNIDVPFRADTDARAFLAIELKEETHDGHEERPRRRR